MKKFKTFEATDTEEAKTAVKQPQNKPTPFLDAFGKDLTKLAKEGRLEPVIGRDKEIFQVLWVLSRKTKNNPVIIGEPGVGKTCIVEAIAKRIADKKCPETLVDKKIYYLDMASLSGDLEKKAKALLNELEGNRDIILFIDEIHLMINKTLPIDAANIFKPALARGEMRCIGATTLNEFRNSIEKDGALERRFQKIMINEPSEDDTIEILNRIKNRFEDFHKVKYSNDAIIACVKLSGRYITDRFFPDKAIDLLDEVGAKLRLSNTKEYAPNPPEIIKLEKELEELRKEKTRLLKAQDFEKSSEVRQEEIAKQKELEAEFGKHKTIIEVINISDDDVNNTVALKTGIPVERVSKDEGERLVGMEKELRLSIIGQDEAVSKISKFIRRSRAGLKDPNRPGGVFLFLGGTGIGKTHVAKMLSKYIFGSEKDLIRIDMTEYKEKHNVSRLIGSPPGYVGYGEGGQLTEKVRRKPYSIVLLDEIEKAHPDVLNILLQVFDDGHLTDGTGKKVDFKNTIIIMTSNVGARAVAEVIQPVGFGNKKTVMEDFKKDAIKKSLYSEFLPEFINRIDDIIIFAELEKENIYKIIDLEISKLSDKLKGMGYTLSITDNVKDLIMEIGYDKAMGARPLKRAIQTHLEDPIADEILAKKIKDKVEIDYDKEAKKLIINGNAVTERKRIKNWNSFKRV